jgi:catechol 2,3-dioxygenase-like lactoylglutathione lyase family enzyme
MAARKRSGARTAGLSRARPKKSPARPKKTVNRRTTAAPARAAAKARERRVRDPETLRLRAFEPGLTVNDLDQSLRFYVDVLGFVAGDRWSDGGVQRGVMLKAGSSQLSLSQDDWAKGRDRKKGEGVRIWCRTAQDIDRLAARIKAAGGHLTAEPSDQPWGGRSLAVDDPDGYHLTISREK